MDENIFEALSKQTKKKKNQAIENKPSADPLSKSDPVSKSDGNSQLGIGEMWKKMQDMKEDLEKQLSNVYQKGKEAKIDVDLLMDRAGGSVLKQSINLKEREKILNDAINGVILPEACLRKNAKSKDKLTQERKGKMRGVRNKWIPVK